MPGRKTHEQQIRTLERKDDLAKTPELQDAETAVERGDTRTGEGLKHPDARHSEMPVSRQGAHQESEHNKHNKPEKGAEKH